MPIPPAPFTLTCACCSWKKTIFPQSDVLVLERDWFITCPNCHSPSLGRRGANHKEILRTRLEKFLSVNKQ
ncbi:hypothetical protein DZA21_31690 [Pseudomonas aeruginosa]|nr:hypothetical protein [Pseudomonas aeruginosa]RTX24854.1 hypothetical protein DZA21_31690 [Pseudomonas aeruginosa]